MSKSSPKVIEGMYSRAIAIIDLLVMRWPDSIGVREVAGEVGLSRTTVNRILMHLSDLSAARALTNGRYRLGDRILLDAWVASRRNNWLRAVRSEMRTLAAAATETALLALVDDRGFARLIDVAESNRRLRYRVARGARVPLSRGALGRAIMGATSDEQFDRLLASGRLPDTTAQHQRRARDRAAIGDHGYIVSIGERIPEAMGISAPIVVDHHVRGALTVTIPRVREQEIDALALGVLVSGSAHRIEDAIGGIDLADVDPIAPPRQDVPTSNVGRLVATIDQVLLTGQASISRIEDLANCTSPTARRLIGETVAEGLFDKQQSRLVLGPAALAWISALGDVELQRIQHDILAALAARFDETVALGILVPAERRLVLAQVCPGTKPFHYALEVGGHLYLTAGAAGKAVLAHLPSHTWPRELDRFTGVTITDPDVLTADLKAIREAGVSVSYGEQISDAVGVAAPVFDGFRVVGSITVSTPRYRFDDSLLPQLTEAVREAAAAATVLMTAAHSSEMPAAHHNSR